MCTIERDAQSGKVKQKRRRVPKEKGECLTQNEVIERYEEKLKKSKKKKQTTNPGKTRQKRSRAPSNIQPTRKQSKKATKEAEDVCIDACYLCGVKDVSDWMACELCDRWLCSNCFPTDLDKTETLKFLCDSCGTCIY